MNVFVEYVGHLDLDHSMYLLFEKRLGANLYRPDASDPEWIRRLRVVQPDPSAIPNPRISTTPWKHVITFDEFLSIDFDVMVTTTWENEQAFADLVREHKPGAVFVRHIANVLEGPMICKNILRSTLLPMDEVNWIQYVPEHRAEYTFNPVPVGNTIKSFSPDIPICPPDISAWTRFKAALPEFEFTMHGHNGLDGAARHVDMPKIIRECTFVWHTNGNGCCGYIPRPSLACGKPLLVRLEYFQRGHTVCMKLLQDGVNCIDIDPAVRSFEKSIELIQQWSEPEFYARKSKQIYDKFNEDVNFAREAENIRVWLESCPSGV